MTKIIVGLCLILSVSISVFSQRQMKDLTNEMIWSSNKFSPEYVYSVRSMLDGEHFTALE